MTERRSLAIGGGVSGIVGVLMLGVSFLINAAPPVNPTSAQLLQFGEQHFASILWGGWLQAVGPVFIVLFAFALVHLAGAAQRFSGWMTFFGATVLMTVSLIEVTFYFGALHTEPAVAPLIALNLVYAVQHLYFIVAAPALFIPLGLVLTRTAVLPRAFGYAAVLLGAGFVGLGIAYQTTLTLPLWVTAFGGVQAIWWLAAAVALILRYRRINNERS